MLRTFQRKNNPNQWMVAFGTAEHNKSWGNESWITFNHIFSKMVNAWYFHFCAALLWRNTVSPCNIVHEKPVSPFQLSPHIHSMPTKIDPPSLPILPLCTIPVFVIQLHHRCKERRDRQLHLLCALLLLTKPLFGGGVWSQAEKRIPP